MILTMKHIAKYAVDAYQRVRVMCRNEARFEGGAYKIPAELYKSRIINWFVDGDTLVLQIK